MAELAKQNNYAPGAFAGRLEAFALAPDNFEALELVQLEVLDQSSWVVNQYEKILHDDATRYEWEVRVLPPAKRSPPPQYIWTQPGRELLRPPAFLGCFDAQVQTGVTGDLIR